jgi:GST-like protein
MLKLYAFATPNNLKPVIMMEELGLEYELHSVNIRQGEQKADAFQKLNPNAKVPVLVDPEGRGKEFVLTESAAILVYLAEKYGKFMAATVEEKARVFEQLFFHASGISPAFGNSGFFQKLASEKVPMAIDRFHAEAKRLTGLLDAILANNEYVAGNNYTIADMAHFGWMWRSAFAGIDSADYPNVKRWYDQVASRQAVKVAITKLEALVPPTP